MRRSNDIAGEDRAKVRVLFAEVEGNNQSVQEALRTMVSAMNRPLRVVSAKASVESPALIQQPAHDLDAVDEDVDNEVLVEEVSSSGEANGRKPRGSGQKIDRNAGIALVHDLNFRPEGKPTLRDFFAEKGPDNDMEYILVVVYFMQQVMGVSKIGLGHIRTALVDVSKAIPLDLKQTVRNMRGKKAWVKYTDLSEITTATAGENHVLHDMGKKG